MKLHPNPLALMALPSLAALLYLPTGELGFLGFLGHLVFLRYLRVAPDELFLFTVRRAATLSFFVEAVLLSPALALFYALEPGSDPMPKALAISYAAALIFFCLYHTWLEVKEMRGLE